MSNRPRLGVAVACSALALVGAACAAPDETVTTEDEATEASPSPEPPKELDCPHSKGRTVSASYYVVPGAKAFGTPEAAAHELSDAFDGATAMYAESDRSVFMVNEEDELIAIVLVLEGPDGWYAHGMESCAGPPLYKDKS